MTVPDWVQDAIFYQIFPDRFANGDPTNDPPNVRGWNERPTRKGFHGGDLRGVIQHFDYLLDIGVNAIYFNPIFLAASNHRYDTIDYFRIDPKLGDQGVFHELIGLAHQNGVRIILDGVFNHCGRGFFAFADVLGNQEHSPYLDWFHIRGFPLNAYDETKDINYLAWWNLRNLPKFNTDTPAVREYLFSVARHWIEQGADGWRLDVPGEIDDDSFWEAFRSHVKSVRQDAYLVGEIWEVDPRWVGDHHFDGLMNYPMREALLDFLVKGSDSAPRFSKRIEAMLHAYSQANSLAHYLPLGSHDTERLWTVCAGDERKVRQAFLFQMCYPGAPAIYYGDEIGMSGGGDPDCRGAFPLDEAQWNHSLRDYVKNLVALRHRFPALRRGEYKTLMCDDGGIFAFVRLFRDQAVITALNASDESREVNLDVVGIGWQEGYEILEALDQERLRVSSDGLRLHLPARGGALLHVAD